MKTSSLVETKARHPKVNRWVRLIRPAGLKQCGPPRVKSNPEHHLARTRSTFWQRWQESTRVEVPASSSYSARIFMEKVWQWWQRSSNSRSGLWRGVAGFCKSSLRP
jgi:hypothetical protein